MPSHTARAQRAVLGFLLAYATMACSDDAAGATQGDGDARADAGHGDGDGDGDGHVAHDGGDGDGDGDGEPSQAGQGGSDHGGHSGAGGTSSSAGTGGRGPSDAGDDEPDASRDAGLDADTDAADSGDEEPQEPQEPTILNGCESFVDRTAFEVEQPLTWDYETGNRPSRCMRIRVGQVVCWVGSLDDHPLAPYGGDTPTPITGAECALFETPGDYGYICTLHPEMLGVIQVVP